MAVTDIVEVKLTSVLGPLVADAVYPDIGPDGGPLPYITYQQVGGIPVNFLSRDIPSQKNGRFQINVWSDNRETTSILARQVEDTLRGSLILTTEVMGGAISVYEEATNLYGAYQDFSLWF